MKCEWPVLTRCCFCLPLRPGLLTIIYVKFIHSAFMVGLDSYLIHTGGVRGGALELSLALYTLELLVGAFMLYGAHMKLLYILKCCFYYAFTSSIVKLLAEFLDVAIGRHYDMEVVLGWCIAGVFIQFYLLTILWNVMKKLEASECQQLENPLQHFVTAQAAWSMDSWTVSNVEHRLRFMGHQQLQVDSVVRPKWSLLHEMIINVHATTTTLHPN